MGSKTLLWLVNMVVAILAAINAIAWGYCVKEVGDPKPSLNFLLRLVFNRWFIAAMASAFTASLLSYAVLREMGVLAGRFFLALQTVAVVIACTIVLGESPTLREWVGAVIIVIGLLLLGK